MSIGIGVSASASVRACLIAGCVAFALSACASSSATKTAGLTSDEGGFSPRVVAKGKSIPKGGGHHKLGRPYTIAGKRYVPAHQPNYDRVGIASWYGDLFHGRLTANGEVYDSNRLTAAHPTLPLPSLVKVTNLANGRQVLLRVNDRGPYAHNRIIDLSRKASDVLGTRRQGLAKVRVEYIGPAPLSGDDSRERAFLAGKRGYATAAARPTPKAAPRKTRRSSFSFW
ncbi:MAG: septal ring lytic transglycosylase RlpA family protein [Pseudomonadota bacterium]